MVRSSEERAASFKFIRGYAYRECSSIVIGLIFLVGAQLSDFAIPMFIGWTIDLLEKEQFEEVGVLCLYMLIIILVRAPFPP